MKYLVLGSGMMGRAVAYDLARWSAGDTVIIADIDLQRAENVARETGLGIAAMRLDANDDGALGEGLRSCDVVISAISYAINERVTRAAIQAGVHMCDLGGNNDVVERQLELDAEARSHHVSIVPNCGLAPGLINILAVTGMQDCDTVDTIRLRVGGLPQHPRPPLNYQIVFSVEGLVNEYVERAEIIEEGKRTTVESLSGLEEIMFPAPFGAMEAFHTSGGISRLTHLLSGKVRNLDYKTIRYKGHCDKFKTLLDLGFATNEPMLVGGKLTTLREFFTDLLQKKLSYGDTDVILARATISGRKEGKERHVVYECIDYCDETTRMTAMMRTTAFPTAIIARMLADGTITRRGVLPPEECVPGNAMIGELAKRDIAIAKRITEPGS